jgi:hypothetical protein
VTFRNAERRLGHDTDPRLNDVDPDHPPLTRQDAWLLAALTEGSHDGRAVDLRSFVHDADWLDRAIPTFDELSFGLPRLVAAGFLRVGQRDAGGLTFSATTAAIRMRRRNTRPRLGEVILDMEREVGARPRPERETEDRRLGRLPGLTERDLETAIAAHARWVDGSSSPLVIAARVISRWVNRKRA